MQSNYRFEEATSDYQAFEYWENGGEVFEFRGFGGRELGVYRGADCIGTIELTEGFHPSIEDAWQGIGLGKRMYQHWIQYQMLMGWNEVRSDASVSTDSQRVWHSLIKLGYEGQVGELLSERWEGQSSYAVLATRPVAASADFLPWDDENQEVAA